MISNGTVQLSEDPADGTFSYRVDVAEIAFSDENANAQWIQAMPIGNYTHPRYGKISITANRVKRFADNVNAQIRGQKLDIDYDHKADPNKGHKAAGWVEKAEARPDGLWIFVEWVQSAADAIRNGEYRYFSPEYNDSWKHPASGIKFTDVLFGGALTNRPFLKGIAEIKLSEEDEEDGGPFIMNRKALEALASIHGIQFSEDTSDADLQAKVEAAAEADDFAEGTEENSDDDNAEDNGDDTGDDDDNDVELSEDVAALVKELNETRKRLSVVEAGAKVSKINTKLSELNGEGDIALTPVATKMLSDILVSTDSKTGDAIIAFAEKVLAKDGTVQLGEQGSSSNGSTDSNSDNSAAKEFSDAVTKLMSENKDIDYADAATQISIQDAALWDRYEREVMTGGAV